MVFTDEDRVLIKNLFLLKGYGARRLLQEFPDKNWKENGIKALLKKIRKTGSVERQKGSGRPRSERTPENIDTVNDLVLSQEGAPKTHRTTRQIARDSGLSQSSVVRIIHKDLHLKCLKRRRAHELTEANRINRLTRAKQLLRKYPAHSVDFIWFSDEKIFTVATPKNTQNDRLYAASTSKKRDIERDRLLRTRPTFTPSVMVSVAVSKLGYTDLFFVQPGVKVDGKYYRDVLLSQQMLPLINEMSSGFFTFQQDGAPAHRARETVALLRQQTPDFIEPELWPPNSPDLNPVDYRIWGVLQERVYREPIRDVEELKQRLMSTWSHMKQGVIDEAIDQWRKRLLACVRAEGRHFEHLL